METLKLNPKRAHRKAKPHGEAKAVFLPIDVTDELVESRDGSIEIALENGLRITLNGNFNPEAVAQLVRGLSA